eukprot:TRINITY_DN3318_c0_g1_i1.p1 TRINITY_DN3318_c0_g1~~TRINITY_DN3318_c0_g1_i1.p1  ORF type:complete len:469 (+),score=55.97 TRINITY_DN3318_c0_g1_i1:153-1409(+)
MTHYQSSALDFLTSISLSSSTDIKRDLNRPATACNKNEQGGSGGGSGGGSDSDNSGGTERNTASGIAQGSETSVRTPSSLSGERPDTGKASGPSVSFTNSGVSPVRRGPATVGKRLDHSKSTSAPLLQLTSLKKARTSSGVGGNDGFSLSASSQPSGLTDRKDAPSSLYTSKSRGAADTEVRQKATNNPYEPFPCCNPPKTGEGWANTFSGKWAGSHDTFDSIPLLDSSGRANPRHITVLDLPGCVCSSIPYVKGGQVKRELNQQFWKEHPQLKEGDITLSKIQKLRQRMLSVAMHHDIDLSTVALASVSFERIIGLGYVVKENRHQLCAACFLLAVKFNHHQAISSNWLRVFFETVEKEMDVAIKEVLGLEVHVYRELGCGLLVQNARQLSLHLSYLNGTHELKLSHKVDALERDKR